MKMMTIDGRRRFKFNGRSFEVCDLPKADRTLKEERYYVCEKKGDFRKVVYNVLGWEMPKFHTIKEAQRYIRDNESLIDTIA